ncbi:hypothetical protein K0M31_002850 [Melipona bicolor]|uniref:Uncharacterized protein n=1 Tax=Melipona bicolor TaxID=60889 RepID=A0AA40KPW1_9HYME|nr:hypothetical protein K0M31_002850 [Melipona bicolor]
MTTFSRQSTTSASRQSYTTSFGGLCKVSPRLVFSRKARARASRFKRGMFAETDTVDPDTHIDSLEQAEQIVLEGTSKWSCKIAITGDTMILIP